MEAVQPFVPAGWSAPRRLVSARFVLEPLGPRHNDADYAAWSSSIAHIRSTPGFATWSWPREMSLEENLADLEMHARHFEEQTGFTYTVRESATGDIVGCVYIYPLRGGEAEAANEPASQASVRSWVRADRAELDAPLWEDVSAWLERDWPFTAYSYATRADAG